MHSLRVEAYRRPTIAVPQIALCCHVGVESPPMRKQGGFPSNHGVLLRYCHQHAGKRRGSHLGAKVLGLRKFQDLDNGTCRRIPQIYFTVLSQVGDGKMPVNMLSNKCNG